VPIHLGSRADRLVDSTIVEFNDWSAMSPDQPEAGTPQTVLFARVRKHAEQRPFVPFRIVTTSGRSYDVPTADHIGFLPLTRMIIVADDNFGSAEIFALHVASIEPLRRSRGRKRAA
jgi:hypothetical protein